MSSWPSSASTAASATPSRSAAPVVSAERLALALLAGTLGGMYLVGAATAASPGLAALQVVVALAELAWAAVSLLGDPEPALLRSGAALQIGLVVLWGLSRTAGLDGPPLPVGAIDGICAVDEIVIAACALRASTARRPAGPTSMLRCQLAAMLAGMTLFTLGAAHAHAPGSRGGFFGGAPGGHFLCRPL